MSDSTIASVTAPDSVAVAAGPHRPRLSAFVLTKNEESNLDPCLQSLVPCCDDIHLVDSFSTDRTLEIARKYDAQIHQHAFEKHTAADLGFK
jgi:glycosyltransferase involved in cell wall biosynthesis